MMSRASARLSWPGAKNEPRSTSAPHPHQHVPVGTSLAPTCPPQECILGPPWMACKGMLDNLLGAQLPVSGSHPGCGELDEVDPGSRADHQSRGSG